ncbi:hypothetical protein [Rhodococcus sp. IEGM 1408]|uniref:hypothetical protein n=1 Tax=Rhodococcus sp. IEGM 1408 TaxID=3082220 RepID=UPI002955D4A2|nr:hypothetical protein [Rhodococcus sp. IEGM 1408]MDV8003175.1 hypothetical protein [Rhodococcus sp. IEGM 1408]
MGMSRIRRDQLRKKKPDPLEGKDAASIDWSRAEARARSQMERSRARTLEGVDYAAKAPSTYRMGGRRDTGAIS